MFFVTTTATHIFLNVAHVIQLDDNNLAALQAAETVKCD